MRPVKLSMTAFGPYDGIETVDFRHATDAGLFGIYGPTGSGKSSIFSAMAFALFGEGARHEQPTSSMRSGLAAADALTEVAFIFELGAKRYFVRRQPEQPRPKLRGDGETTSRHQAWLFDVTDIEVDAVTSDNCGTVLAEGKLGAVDGKIRGLLGYGVDQFRQIVLLPQGQFEKFLASNSEDRLKILRGLFDVSLYRAMTEQLKAQAAEARRAVEDGRRVQQQQLASAGFASTDELASAIEAAAERCGALDGERTQAEVARVAADEALAAGEALAQRFSDAAQAATTLKQLEERKPEIETLAARHRAAEQARRLLDLDEARRGAGETQDAAQARLAAAETRAQTAVAAHAGAQAELEKLNGRASEIDELKRRATELARFETLLREADDLKIAADEAVEAGASASAHADATAREAQRLANAMDETRASLDRARAQSLERAGLSAADQQARAALFVAQDYQRAVLACADADQSQTDASGRAQQARTHRTACGDALRQSQAAFIAGQAQLLAGQLDAGQPCPVCGSEHHPAPASGDRPAEGLEEAWRDAQMKLSDAGEAVEAAEAELAAATSRKQERQARLDGLAVPELSIAELESDLERSQAALGALGAPLDAEALGVELAALTEALSAAQAAKEEARTKDNAAAQQAALSRQSYDDQIAAVPMPYRDVEALTAEAGEVRGDIRDRETALEEARAANVAAEAAKAGATADLTNANNRFEEAQKAVEVASAALQARRDALGLTDQAYAEARPDIERLDDLAGNIASFREELLRAEGRHAQAQAAIAELDPPDLGMLRGASDTARDTAGGAARAAAEAAEARSGLERLRDGLAAERERLATVEAESGPLRKVAEAFSGENMMKTSLEAYALGAMFDQVLEAANLRLDPMTQGRYRLERDMESVGGRARRGLDILVHDIQTGRARAVTTLSGGETFIAALALALGLSDIVEMSHGAIRLDTIFIDEGFGSLDSDGESGTLDQVLQVLQDIVGQQRAVGLISHVPLVQQAVPTGFNIIKRGNGSSRIEERVG